MVDKKTVKKFMKLWSVNEAKRHQYNWYKYSEYKDKWIFVDTKTWGVLIPDPMDDSNLIFTIPLDPKVLVEEFPHFDSRGDAVDDLIEAMSMPISHNETKMPLAKLLIALDGKHLMTIDTYNEMMNNKNKDAWRLTSYAVDASTLMNQHARSFRIRGLNYNDFDVQHQINTKRGGKTKESKKVFEEVIKDEPELYSQNDRNKVSALLADL